MVIAEQDIEVWCEQLRKENKKIIFTNGCFDILHAGHVRYLESAKALGDCLVIGLNSDASVRALKGESRPINNEEDRAEVLGALRAVDCIVIFGDQTAENLITKVRPNIYVKGGDYTVETLPEAKIVLGYGGQIEFVPLVTGRSSSNIINKIKSTEK
jgi:D-glycero-beta-D-manno-heptose 1-phosphate adenylyltransferase